jgi:hypothetical protein
MAAKIIARSPKEDENAEDYHVALMHAFNRISGWLECFLDDVNIVSSDLDMDMYKSLFMVPIDNQIIQCPSHPGDDILAQLLHSKLNAIANGDIRIISVEVSGKDNKPIVTTSYMYESEDGEYDLPSQKEFSGKNALHSEPWWKRYDCDTFDYVLEKGEKRDELLEKFDSKSFFEEMASAIYGEEKEADVIEPSWKPKSI